MGQKERNIEQVKVVSEKLLVTIASQVTKFYHYRNMLPISSHSRRQIIS